MFIVQATVGSCSQTNALAYFSGAWSIKDEDKNAFYKGAFTLPNFARDFALSLHVLLNKNYLFSLLNVQASAK